MFIIRSRSDAIKDEVIKRLHETEKPFMPLVQLLYITMRMLYGIAQYQPVGGKGIRAIAMNGKTLYAIYALSEGEELPETINGPAIFLTVK